MTGVDYANNAGGKGWNRTIKYNKKEYGEFIRRVQGVIERLGVRAVDVERVGWVLGREKAVIQGGLETASDLKETSTPARPQVKKETKTSAKRKTGESMGAVENREEAGGSRRSKRLRKGS
jgi:hypothetical protein